MYFWGFLISVFYAVLGLNKILLILHASASLPLIETVLLQADIILQVNC